MLPYMKVGENPDKRLGSPGETHKYCEDARRVNGAVASKVMPFSYDELEQFYEKLVTAMTWLPNIREHFRLLNA